jgi:hypothetical protein
MIAVAIDIIIEAEMKSFAWTTVQLTGTRNKIIIPIKNQKEMIFKTAYPPTTKSNTGTAQARIANPVIRKPDCDSLQFANKSVPNISCRKLRTQKQIPTSDASD